MKHTQKLFILCLALLAFSFFTHCKKKSLVKETPGEDPLISIDTSSASTQDPAEKAFEKEPELKKIRKCDRPALVWSAASQPDPSTIHPAIFYSPHQDDETLGMGATIAEHVRKGKPVYVVLLADGANPGNADKLGMTPEEYVKERMREFIEACQKLGVHRIYISNRGSGFVENDLATMTSNFMKTMRYFSIIHPGASHKTVSGNCDTYNDHCDRHPTHQAATNAMRQLYSEKVITDVRLFRVYVYYLKHFKKYKSSCTRPADWLKPVDDADKKTRQNAFAAYRNDADSKRGIGYWSVKILFDKSEDSEYEYVDFVENDCQ